MSYQEHNRYSYVRAYREVVASLRLEKLSYQLGRAALHAVTPKDSTWLKLPDAMEDSARPKEQTIEGIDLPKIKIYEADKLWLTQFEVIMPRSERNNRKLDRLYARIKNSAKLRSVRASLKETHQVSEPLIVRARSFVDCTIPEHSNLGREFGLQLEGPQNNLDFLIAEETEIYDFVNSTGIGNELKRWQRPRSKVLPMFRLPPDITRAQSEIFMEMAQGSVPRDGLDVQLNVLDLRPKTPE
ncbi:MAG TPA: hypothetical protein VFI84_00655 [Candidatus Saccharimonadales bacterium]|nr:hypothetical protein [Candidatus Saccharimonadales bacterium]